MKNEIVQEQLSIVISQQAILSQKCSILLAVNTFILTALITAALTICPWILLLALLSFISIFTCIYIIWPNFKSGNESKYWYDFPEMSIEEIYEQISDEQNTLMQIKTNSIILRKKYKLFKFSLGISFLMIPYLIEVFIKIIRRN